MSSSIALIDRTIRKGDVGVDMIFTVKEPDPANPGDLIVKDISTATIADCLIRWKKPSGTVATRIPSFVVAGADGKIHFNSIAADFDEAGQYSIEALIALPAGDITTSETHFLVEDTLA